MSVRSRILGPPVIKMPSGLVEIMDGLARDVLKNNPENIYEFCARHMQTLLEIRDGRVIRPLLTLDEKIEIAQKKVKQRAEQRQRAYDKKNTDANKQVNEITSCNDDSESSEKKQVDNALIGVHTEEKEEIVNDIESQGLEKTTELLTTELKNETDEKDDLNKESDQEEMKGDENNSNNQETITDNNEDKDLISEGELENDYNIKDNKTKDNIENKPSDEVQPIVITSDKTKLDDNATESNIDEALTKLVSSDSFQEKMRSPSDIHLNTEDTEIMDSNCGTKIQNEVENNKEVTNDGIHCIDTKEKEAVTVDVNPEENSNFGTDIEQYDKMVDAPSTTNSLNENGVGTNLDNETKNNSTEIDIQNSKEPDESQDNQILTVILGSNDTANTSLPSNESITVQSDEIKPVETIEPELISKELDLKSQQNIDSENAPKIDKNNSMNNSMDLETAAITIQKVFRSFLFKTKTASYDDPTAVDITLLTEHKEKEENEVMNIKDRRPLGISRMDTVLQTVNEEKSLSLSTDDSSTLSSAATVIQAHVRGYLVRNKLNSNKTISSNSLIDSDAPSIPSLEADSDNIKSKTILNIHIVPEGGHFVSRDESILTSMDLSLDSPPSSVNLHPLGYDKSERRKQLKREDAIQSVSPPSNNSGKLSEDHDSVKEVLPVENNSEMETVISNDTTSAEINDITQKEETENDGINIEKAIIDAPSDEMDVVTPFVEGRNSRESNNSSKLLHSGEFHDIVVPTNVTRSDTSVVRGE